MGRDTKLKGKKKHVVFIVEDDQFIVKVYEMKFQKEGVEVIVASNGVEAMSFLDKEPPTVVLLDLMLPGLSGFDILEAIRKNKKWKDVPVFILTSLGQPQDIERGKKLGVIEYIIKPYTKIQDVVDKVKIFFV